MEKPAPEIAFKKEENFTLLLDNKQNNAQFVIEISLSSGKINIQAINNIGNNILNYEALYDFDSLIKISDYFKFCKDINKVYDFILQLKNNKALSLIKENENLFFCLHLSQPIENIVKIPLNKASINNKSIILSLYEKNKQLKEKIIFLEDKLEKNYEKMRLRLIKRDIKGYSENLIFIENEIEKQLKKNVISYNLLYKATRDGDKSENFHSKCDNKENTLVIITTTAGKKFGGFTTKLWNHSGYVKDPLAFAFSINNQKIYNIVDNINGEYAIYANQLYGPCFGNGTSFGLYSGCIQNNNNWCNDSKTYNYNYNHLSGVNRFQALDYEVYQVIVE